MRRILADAVAAALGVALVALVPATRPADAQPQGPPPERVTFMSADGKTMLVGYLYRPARMSAPRAPAVVMMHGRAGAYSSRANGVYDASTLSLRHQAWGRAWADAGYLAVLVDGFGPRGYPQGFGRFSYDSRPAALNEVTVRPLDAAGALAWLRARPDVIPDRIGLQGWSNGASAVLATMSPVGPCRPPPASAPRSRSTPAAACTAHSTRRRCVPPRRRWCCTAPPTRRCRTRAASGWSSAAARRAAASTSSSIQGRRTASTRPRAACRSATPTPSRPMTRSRSR